MRRKLLIPLAVLTALALAYPQLKSHLQATAVLKQVSGGPVPYALAISTTNAITTEDIELPNKTRARIYLPENPVGALVIFHGVHHLGIDEPRLESFAAALATCGIQVLTPELPHLKDYTVDQLSIKQIGEAATYFAQQTHQPVGIMGLSFAGGLALLAAADPTYSPSIKFVVAIGSQDSMAHVTTYYRTSQADRPDHTTQTLPAHEYGALVSEYDHLEDFLPAQDLEAIRPVLRAHLYEDKQAEAQALARLTPAQKIEATNLLNSTSDQTRTALQNSVALHIEEANQLSPHSHITTLQTPVYLLHGEADNIIPASETLWLASELPPNTLKAVLISPVLSHLDMQKQPTTRDQWNLIHFFAKIIRAAHKN